jgi:hypothetical protein
MLAFLGFTCAKIGKTKIFNDYLKLFLTLLSKLNQKSYQTLTI